MTHEDEGHYAAKHPTGTKPDAKMAQAVDKALVNGKLGCTAATKISRDLGVPMAEVGKTADLLEVRINKCIYGLFGRMDKDGNKKPVKPAESVSEEMKDAINAKLVDGRLSCADGWEIADRLGVPRASIAGICEALKIKINKCQLGAF